jgi:nucleoid DNA-binding protein
MNKEDIYWNTARDCNVSEDKVKFIIDNFWTIIRSYLTNPLKTKKGILLGGLGKFYIKPFIIKKRLKTIKLKINELSTRVYEGKVEYYKTLLKQLTNE